MIYDNNLILQIQQANDIVEVISEHLSLTKKGREMVGLCPFHSDHKPSMNVSGVKQIFKCFACGAGGDVFKFIQMRENLTFPQSVERLAQRANIKITPSKSSRGKTNHHPDINPNELTRLNKWAAQLFHRNLLSSEIGKKTMQYLQLRNISEQSIKDWQLGLAFENDGLIKKAREKRIPEKLLYNSGLTVAGHDKFINRLMFPITDVTSRHIGFGARTLDKTEPKYLNSPATALFDKSSCLYGLSQGRDHIAKSETVIVVEGYTDCIMAHQEGCKNVVAALGTSFTTQQARLLRRFAKKVILIFDSDVAGTEAANRAMEICLTQKIDIKIASVPQGKDPCDFIISAGKVGFEKLAYSATDIFQFKYERLAENLSSEETLAGKKNAIEQFLQTIATAVYHGNLSAIEKGLLVNRISKITTIAAEQINSELTKKLTTADRTARLDKKNQQVVSIDTGGSLAAQSQKEIIEVLLNEPSLFDEIKHKISPEYFESTTLKQIAKILFEILNENTDITLTGILANIESVQIAAAITQLAEIGEQKGNYNIRINDAVDVLKDLKNKKTVSQISTVEDQNEFLKNIGKNVTKENRRNIGMI